MFRNSVSEAFVQLKVFVQLKPLQEALEMNKVGTEIEQEVVGDL